MERQTTSRFLSASLGEGKTSIKDTLRYSESNTTFKSRRFQFPHAFFLLNIGLLSSSEVVTAFIFVQISFRLIFMDFNVTHLALVGGVLGPGLVELPLLLRVERFSWSPPRGLPEFTLRTFGFRINFILTLFCSSLFRETRQV